MGTTTGSRSAARLGIGQMLTLMRVEFQRARAGNLPLCCWMIHPGSEAGVDAAYETLKREARRLSAFGMALSTKDRIMAIFPGREPASLSALAEAMLGSAPGLRIGGAHNQLAETSASFEGLVERAGRALHQTEVSSQRCLVWREHERELEGLRSELKAAEHSLGQSQAEAAEFAQLERAALVEKLQGLFAGLTPSPELEQLEREVLALAAHELLEERSRAVADHQRQIALLERRIEKLTVAMGITEQQLENAMQQRTMDAGVASIYRTVQGLTANDSNREQKKAMMASIFEQNLALQHRSAEKPAAT
ncbi:MAG: hypothetical protein RL277_1674 [Planctomycetota bacterium]|jgi:hypothetical protein